MTFPFDPHQGLIIIPTELSGPSGTGVLQFALDTGATTTLVSASLLVALGYDPGASANRVEVTTGSGVAFAPRVTVSRIKALGDSRRKFHVLAQTLPPSAGIDGLLGLDFFRRRTLNIDFRTGQITLA